MTEKITLTKQTAIEILKNMHPTQRELNWPKVYSYKRHMDYGLFKTEKWPPIEFCENYRLTNGQHRVMAFLLSNMEKITFKLKSK